MILDGIGKVFDWFIYDIGNVTDQLVLNRQIFLTLIFTAIAIVLIIKAARKSKFYESTLRPSGRVAGKVKVDVDSVYKEEMKERQARERALAEVEYQKHRQQSIAERFSPQELKNKLNPKRIARSARKNRRNNRGE